MLHSLFLITLLTFGSLLQVEPVEVGPKMAVARQELQDPNPQALVPHVGAQRFQARGEALVHRRGVSRASIPPLPLPLPLEVVPGQAPRVCPGHIHWRVDPIRHCEVG